jgi:cupin fold WbuC family metalloprotein
MTETTLQRIDARMMDELAARAQASPRRRQNLNLHPQLDDPIQRFLNAGEPDTYIRPHRHRPAYWELVTVLRGRIDALLFDDHGVVIQRHAMLAGSGIEIPGATWHSFVFVEPGTVALEVKPGPYDAQRDSRHTVVRRVVASRARKRRRDARRAPPLRPPAGRCAIGWRRSACRSRHRMRHWQGTTAAAR